MKKTIINHMIAILTDEDLSILSIFDDGEDDGIFIITESVKIWKRILNGMRR